MKKILLFLALCASFTMMAQETEVVKGILPSGLTSSVVDNNATFKFYSMEDSRHSRPSEGWQMDADEKDSRRQSLPPGCVT